MADFDLVSRRVGVGYGGLGHPSEEVQDGDTFNVDPERKVYIHSEFQIKNLTGEAGSGPFWAVGVSVLDKTAGMYWSSHSQFMRCGPGSDLCGTIALDPSMQPPDIGKITIPHVIKVTIWGTHDSRPELPPAQ